MAVRRGKDQVLIAVSDARSRRWLKEALTRAGYEVHTARDGEEAVALARAQAPDLVLLDLQGSDADRQSCVVAMRAARPRLKVIVAINSLGAEDLRSADLLGAQAVIARPLTAQALLRRVRELIRRRPPIYDAGDAWPFPLRPQ